MFSYVALVWDPRVADASAASRLLARGFESSPRWRVVLQGQGAVVFVAGERTNVNQAYALAGERGVILGKLFRSEGPAPSTRHFADSPGESDNLVRTGGRRLLEGYWGRYVALLEARDGGLGVLRDPSGTLPCFRMRHDGVDIVFSWLEDVLEGLPWLPACSVDWDCLAAHIAFGDLTGQPTALEGVTQVMPGQWLELGVVRQAAHLRWDPAELARTNPINEAIDASRALRETVLQCASSWASCYESIVLRLSGGVDSSILACCLSEAHTRTRVTCLNYHSPGADSDERRYARLAAARAQRELVELERDPNVRIEQFLDVARTPNPKNYLGRFGARTDAELAAAVGATATFTGAGGDQLFFEFNQWWPAADYLRLRGLDRGFLGAALDAARLGKVSLWRAVFLALADRFRRHPPPMHIARPWKLGTAALWEPTKHPARYLHPVHAEPSSLPIGKLMQAQQVTHAGGYYDPHLREAAPEPVAPLLSQPLIELCLRLPTYLLTLGGHGRGLARQAFARDLPPEIARRRSKGGLHEQLATVLTHNLDIARQILLDGELVKRGLVDRRGLESVLAGGPHAAPSRAAEIHMYIAVEAWLQRLSTSRCKA